MGSTACCLQATGLVSKCSSTTDELSEHNERDSHLALDEDLKAFLWPTAPQLGARSSAAMLDSGSSIKQRSGLITPKWTLLWALHQLIVEVSSNFLLTARGTESQAVHALVGLAVLAVSLVLDPHREPAVIAQCSITPASSTLPVSSGQYRGVIVISSAVQFLSTHSGSL